MGGGDSAQIRARVGAYFEQYFDTVFGFCVVRCGSRLLAEEVCSDVFSDAIRHLTSTPDADLQVGWFLSVARRRIIDHWRRAERQRARLERLANEPTLLATDLESFDGPDLDDERILHALASLPERQRLVLTARYVDGFSVAEIAESGGDSYKAIESLLARARRGFAAAYRAEGDDR